MTNPGEKRHTAGDEGDKTLVILKAKDGRRFEKVFENYAEATAWIAENCDKHGIKMELEAARFDREPTIEIYKEVPRAVPEGGRE